MGRWLTLLLIGLLITPAFADNVDDYAATYEVSLNGFNVGELKQTLTSRDDDTRKLYSRTKAKGVFKLIKSDVIRETSIVTIADGKVRPQHYTYDRSESDKDKHVELDFDWQAQEVAIDDKKHPWSLDLENNTHDKHAYQLQLMLDLRDSTESLTYRIADGGELKTYKIAVLGEETVNTPLGKIDTIKLRRERDADSERETTLWCAPALGNLPVRLEHKEKDDSRFTAVIKALTGRDISVFEPKDRTPQSAPFGGNDG